MGEWMGVHSAPGTEQQTPVQVTIKRTMFLQLFTGGSPASESLGEATEVQILSSTQIFAIRISSGGTQEYAFLISSLEASDALFNRRPLL